MAVADVYDALRARRPYKEPMSHCEACTLLHKGAGTRFDPGIMAKFPRVAGEFEAITNRLQGG